MSPSVSSLRSCSFASFGERSASGRVKGALKKKCPLLPSWFRLLTFSLLTKYTALFLRTQGQSVRIWKYIDFSFVHKSFVSVYQFFPCHNQRRAEVVKCNLKMNLLIPIIILINIRIIIIRTCNCPVMFWVMTSSWCRSLSKNGKMTYWLSWQH